MNDSVEPVSETTQLVVLTGPIAAGKNSVANELSRRLTGAGHTVVVADVDDVAAMVAPLGPARLACGSRRTKRTAP